MFNFFRKIQKKVSLSILNDGFLLEKNGVSGDKIRWRDVLEIVAFKRDLLTTDLICLVVIVEKGVEQITYEINEDVSGFEAFVEAMTSALSGVDINWRNKVLKEPFSTNRSVLYTKKNQKE